MNRTRIGMAFALVFLLASLTGSVLLFAYVAAAGSLLLVAGVLVKRAIVRTRGVSPSHAPPYGIRLADRPDVDAEAA